MVILLSTGNRILIQYFHNCLVRRKRVVQRISDIIPFLLITTCPWEIHVQPNALNLKVHLIKTASIKLWRPDVNCLGKQIMLGPKLCILCSTEWKRPSAHPKINNHSRKKWKIKIKWERKTFPYTLLLYEVILNMLTGLVINNINMAAFVLLCISCFLRVYWLRARMGNIWTTRCCWTA